MEKISELRDQYIASAGDFTQTLGFGRNIGQIYAHMFLSPTPQSLDDISQSLGISKGSSSMSARQLEQWGAIKRVWIKGERKDYYKATEEFGKIIRKALIDMVGRTMESADTLLDESEGWLKKKHNNGSNDEESVFLTGQIQKLHNFRSRAQHLWNSPIVRLIFK